MGIYIGELAGKTTAKAQFDDTSPYNLVTRKKAKKIDSQFAKPGNDYDESAPEALSQRYKVLGRIKLHYFDNTKAKSFHDDFYVVDRLPYDSLVGTNSGLWKSRGANATLPLSLGKMTPGLRFHILFPTPVPGRVSGFGMEKRAGQTDISLKEQRERVQKEREKAMQEQEALKKEAENMEKMREAKIFDQGKQAPPSAR
ncbi:hypothetical protein FQN52_005031 [Onygenales sp. PD_12]|nr:hypothetical protein FQN53_006183 [Emmonsiellopsis sp. PD_33]KAK2791077.1 hypothetical protein FQN52_005031 [Onygenales sp. PD_12]